CMQAIQLPYTC
nr:immunoglobulin light chain junction region [Macaca mulatta]MOW73335.1 immunoglobulin light chain junction region [Macaca mulatta]MOW73484.1 immunoglobulin light chain junction region [Macaca mulatta]MOW73602.1 immunoglobulin light chain junction region [Macaca mulatta]MOW73837.1 immunoglobulin light chain junction region [Macaca mulatta]